MVKYFSKSPKVRMLRFAAIAHWATLYTYKYLSGVAKAASEIDNIAAVKLQNRIGNFSNLENIFLEFRTVTEFELSGRTDYRLDEYLEDTCYKKEFAIQHQQYPFFEKTLYTLFVTVFKMKQLVPELKNINQYYTRRIGNLYNIIYLK